MAHRWQCQGTGAASTLLLTCGHFFRGSSLVHPLRFRCVSVVVRLLIRNAAPLFYGCRICRIFACSSPVQPLFIGVGFVGIFAAFSPLQPLFIGLRFLRFSPFLRVSNLSKSSPLFIGVQFVRFSCVHGAGYSRTYFVLIHPVSVLPPWSDHGKGDFGPLSRSLRRGWVG